MSYSGRKRYSTRREKNATAWKRLKIVIGFGLAILIVIGFIKRVYIWDTLQWYFK